MFIFEKLDVYQKSLKFAKEIRSFLQENTIEKNINDQLTRAAVSIALNIAEGTGRNTKKDKQNFYYNARGSVHECVASLQILNLEGRLSASKYSFFYNSLDEIARMLSGLIASLK